MKKYNIFYKTVNLINDHYYYGVHRTKDLNDGYKGSGVRLKKAILKYGIENFKTTVLKHFETYQEALDYEAKIVTRELVLLPECYNIAVGGNRGINAMYGYGPVLIDKETGKKVKAKSKKEYEILWNSGKYNGATKNRIIYEDAKGNKYSLYKDDPIIKEKNLTNIFKNKIQCKDKNGKNYLVSENDPRYLNGELVKSAIWTGRKHTQKTKDKLSNKAKLRVGKSHNQYGMCWIYNLELKQCKKIWPNELNEYLKDNWIKGRKMKF